MKAQQCSGIKWRQAMKMRKQEQFNAVICVKPKPVTNHAICGSNDQGVQRLYHVKFVRCGLASEAAVGFQHEVSCHSRT